MASRWRVHPAVLLAPLAACSFDSTGVSAGPVEQTSESSAASTGEPPTSTSTSPATDPTTSTAPTTEPSTATLTSETTETPTTTAVDPTTGTTDTTDTTDTTAAAVCGDGLAQAPEACDGADLAGQTCADFGLVDGTLACADDCSLDFAGCEEPPTCDNDVLDPGEMCDGDDLAGQTCETQGFLGGDLTCEGCAFDTSACIALPADWYDGDFKKRRKLTVPKGKVKGAHTNFPVAVVTLDMATITDLGAPDKLVFATADKTLLSHEVALAEPGRLVAWIELKNLTDADDSVFYVYYANPAAAGTADPPGTWSNGYLGVWHLEEPFVDEQEDGVHVDSTGKGHDGAQHDNHLNDTKCPVGRCQWFGPEDWIELAKPEDFKLGDADATISAWVRTSDTMARGVFAKSNPDTSEGGHVIVGLRNAGKASFEMFGAGSLDSTTTVTNGAHHQIVWTQTKDETAGLERWRLYVDGKEEITSLNLSVPSVDAHLARIAGKTLNSPYPATFEGAIDEVHVSLDDRSADWVATAYENQRDPAKFTVWGQAESLP